MKVGTLRKHLDAGAARAEELEHRFQKILERLFLDEANVAADRFELIAKVTGLHASAPTPTAAMVAVYPSDEQAAAMRQTNGEEAWSLHCTLAFMPTLDPDQAEVVLACLAELAPNLEPLSGEVGGIAAFGDNGNGHPQILLPDVDGLAELRHAVCMALDEAGIERATNHGWTPHITLSYGDTPDPPPSWLIGSPLTFDSVSISVGDVRRDVPLGGALVASGAGATETDVEAEIARVADENPDVDYGYTAWNPGTKTVLRIVGDGTECDYAEDAFLAIDGVEKYEHEHEALPDGWWDAKVVHPPDPPRWVVERDLSSYRLARGRHFASGKHKHPDWAQPHPDELVDSKALVAKFREKAEPVRQKAVEAVAGPALKAAGISFDTTNAFIGRVLAKTGQHVTYIADTTQLNVARIVRDSYQAGLSIPDTAAAIREGMRAAAPARATLIARTEMAGLVNGGSLAAVQVVDGELGGAYLKRWLTAPGARFPRHELDEGLDGQTVALDAVFDVNGSPMQYPGDQDGPPDEVCNCRCTLTYIDKQGEDVGEGDSLVAAVAFPGADERDGGGSVARARIGVQDAPAGSDEGESLTAAATAAKMWPLSDQSEGWDASAADESLRKWASSDGSGDKDKIDWTKYAQGFFWKDSAEDGEDFGHYKLGYVEVLDGKPTAIWRGVTAVAGVLQGARGGVKIPDGDVAAVKDHVASYYAKAAKQYGDEKISPPWENDSAAASDGETLVATVKVVPDMSGFQEAIVDGVRQAFQTLELPPLPEAADVRPERSDQIEPPAADLGTNASEQRWLAILCPEGQATDDGRVLAPGSISWRELPLSLMALLETGEGGHVGAQLAGRIERIWRDDASSLVMAEGVFDDDDFGRNVARLVGNKTLRGNSVDLAIRSGEYGQRDTYVDESGRWRDGVTKESVAAAEDETDLVDVMFGDPEQQIFVVWDAVIGMSTVCPFPAFAEASIALTASGEEREWGIQEHRPMRWQIFLADSIEAQDALTAAAAGIAPVEPPAAWFERPDFTELTPLTVTEDGHVYGHAWEWGSCHIGVQNGCTQPPYSDTDYAYFLTKEVLTAEGERVRVGTITLGTNHPDIYQGRQAAEEHYANTGLAAADIVIGEDEFGGCFSGALRPNVDAERARELRGASVSGDWRPIKGARELIALLAVNVPGFPVPRARSLVASGADGDVELGTLVAAGVVDPRSQDQVAQARRARLSALAARASGGLAGLAALAQRPVELAVGADSDEAGEWDSEQGVMDVMSDISALLNPGDSWRWWVVDLAIGGATAILCDGDTNTYWIVPVTYGDDLEPVLGPMTEWTQVESEWEPVDAELAQARADAQRAAWTASRAAASDAA